MAKILLVEDDRNLAGTVQEWLEFEHYLVEWVETGTDALDMMKSYKYDVIVLDLTIPKMDGIEVCKHYRAQGGQSPVLMLTGRGTVPDKEVGFDAGADDYLTKPFHLKELSARIRALLRRPNSLAGEVLEAGNIALDITAHKVTKAGEEIHLPRMEFALLEFLMRHRGQVFSAEALLDRVWTADSDKSPETIRTSVKKLRSKIDTKGEPSLIRNVHGVGYKLEG